MTSDEDIAFCLEQREQAQRGLTWIKDGARFARKAGNSPEVDVTEMHKAQDEKLVAYWTKRLELLGYHDA